MRCGGGNLSGERSPPPYPLLSPSKDFWPYQIPHDGVPFLSGVSPFSGKVILVTETRKTHPSRPSSIYSITYPTLCLLPFPKTKKGTSPGNKEGPPSHAFPCGRGSIKLKVFGEGEAWEGAGGTLAPFMGTLWKGSPAPLQALSLFLHAAPKGLVEHDKVLLAGDADKNEVKLRIVHRTLGIEHGQIVVDTLIVALPGQATRLGSHMNK